MPQHPLSHGVLWVLEELGGEGGGFVKADLGSRIGWVLIRNTLRPLEEPVHDS